MELHGCDICVKNDKIPISPSLVEILLKDHWPDLVCEVEMELESYFYYKDEIARERWAKDGWSEGDDVTMIHMIWKPEVPMEAWFVIDDNKKNKYIIDDIEQFVKRCNGNA